MSPSAPDPAAPRITGAPSRLPLSVRVGYGAGQVGGQILRDTPALILPIYMTTVLGLEPALAGLVIMIAKIWVVLADPIAGITSDRSRSPRGRRRPFILAGGCLAAACFALLFLAPHFERELVLFLYMTAVYLLLNTGYSMFSVPYLTMASEMSADPHERTRLLAFRNGALAVGLVMGGALAPWIVAWVAGQPSGTPRSGYQVMGIAMAAVIAASTLWVFLGTARAPAAAATEATLPLREQLRVAWSNRPFMVLIGANIVQYVSAGIGYAGGFFFFAYALRLGMRVFDVIPVWIMIISAASIGSMPLLVAAAARFGKMPVYKWCLVLYALSIQGYWLADADSLWIVWLIAIAIGLFNGGFILMSFSVLTDTITFDRDRTGVSREGTLSAVYSAVDKIGNALGSALFLGFLSLVGFVEAGDGSLPAQSDAVLDWIAVGYIAAPALLHVGSILVLNRYRGGPGT